MKQWQSASERGRDPETGADQTNRIVCEQQGTNIKCAALEIL